MPLQIELYSKASDSALFQREFIQFPKKPQELEKQYFYFYPLVHEFILIKKEGRILLRSMICLSPFKQLAYFGLLEFNHQEPEVDALLLAFKDFCHDWCQSHTASKLYGPINFSTWLPYRLNTSSDGGPVFSFEPESPLEYGQLLKKTGFTTNQLFSSKGYDNLEGLVSRTKADYENAIALGFSFEFFNDQLSLLDLQDLHRLSLTIFNDNYLATPIDFETFRALYVGQAKKADNSLSLFIKSPTGERIGFFINFLEHDYAVAKTIGVLNLYRGCGLSNGSMYLSHQKALTTGVNKMVAAMVREGAQSESYGRQMKLLWTHLYEILEMEI
jgi:hypothetical protein